MRVERSLISLNTKLANLLQIREGTSLSLFPLGKGPSKVGSARSTDLQRGRTDTHIA